LVGAAGTTELSKTYHVDIEANKHPFNKAFAAEDGLLGIGAHGITTLAADKGSCSSLVDTST
jgi:hypothetical protein